MELTYKTNLLKKRENSIRHNHNTRAQTCELHNILASLLLESHSSPWNVTVNLSNINIKLYSNSHRNYLFGMKL